MSREKILNCERVLVVEGKDDLHTIVHLLRRHIEWPTGICKPCELPVSIFDIGSVDNMTQDFFSNQLKNPTNNITGVVVDADNSCSDRYNSFRDKLRARIPGMPPEMPREGLILDLGNGKRFGMWVMPDNSSAGMLESFLSHCLKPSDLTLWLFAQQCVEGSRCHGANWIEEHRIKASIYTFLSWIKPPGNPFGTAIKAGALRADSHLSLLFVQWMIDLFDLKSLRITPA